MLEIMKKYLPGDFSELAVESGMKEWIEVRRDRCYEPELYDELPVEIRSALDEWIQVNIRPDYTESFQRSSYGLKADFFRDTGIYVYSGVMDGGLAKAGYKVVNTDDKNRLYSIKHGCCRN